MLRKKFFLDKSTHKPDCSKITDYELTKAIYGRWEDTTIYYSFSTLPFQTQRWFRSKEFYTSTTSIDEMGEQTVLFISDILDTWSAASNNTLKFVHKTSVHPFSQAIYFIFVSSHYLSLHTAQARTITFQDTNKYIKQSYIYLSNNKTTWLDPYSHNDLIYTVTHELGHSLGFEHYHEFYSMFEKLTQISDGVFCSVMPYTSEINTSLSRCYSDCNPDYAIHPGQLDYRIVSIAYQKNFTPLIYPIVFLSNQWENIGYCKILLNFPEAILREFCNSFLLTALHQTIFYVLRNLPKEKNKKIFTEINAHFISNISLTFLLNSLNASTITIVLYTLIYCYEYKKQSNLKLSQYFLNIALGIDPKGTIETALPSLACSILGTFSGSLFSPIQCKSSLIQPKEKQIYTQLNKNQNTFFCKKRTSICTKLLSLFRLNK
jgi:hypothetical protein